MALRPIASFLCLATLAGCTLIDLSQLGGGSGAGQSGGESSAGNGPSGGSPETGGGAQGGSAAQGGGANGGAPPGESYADCVVADAPAVYFRANSPADAENEANLGTLGGTGLFSGIGNTHNPFPGLVADDDQATQFTGQNGDGSIVVTGAEAVFGMFDPFSIELWLKAPSPISAKTLVSYEANGNRLELRVKKRLNPDGDDAIELRILWPSLEERYVTHFLDLEDPQEQVLHIVAVYRQTGDTVFAGDGSAADMVLYLNGEPTSDLAGNDTIYLPEFVAPLAIGNGFEGLLDEVAVYPRELSAAEVARHHAFGLDASLGCDGGM
jgi:hypothetical protein